MTRRVDVLDISHWQPSVDWAEIKRSGVVGVILKCTEGKGYLDPTFAQRYYDAQATGLEVSSYHFMRPGVMRDQMNFYLNTLQPRPGERVVLDHEDAGVSVDDLRWCVEYLESDTRNLQVTIYSGHIIEQQLGDGFDEVLARTSLWTAEYTDKAQPSWPKGTWPVWSLWQYSDEGEVSGVGGPVDLNLFNGDREACKRWLAPAQPVGPPVDSDINAAWQRAYQQNLNASDVAPLLCNLDMRLKSFEGK